MMFKNRVVSNAMWIVGCKIVQAVLGVFVTMISARYLGPSNYGLINYAASVVAFLVPVMQLGFRGTMVQEILENPEKEGTILGTILGLNLISSAGCIVGVISFAAISNAGDMITIAVCGLYSLNLVCQALEMIRFWFQAKLLSRYTALITLAAYVLVAAYRIGLLISGKSIYWYAVSQAIDYMIIAAGLLVLYKKLGGQKLLFSWTCGRDMFSRSKYYIVSELMVTVFAQTDKIMLKQFCGPVETGYYAAAITCVGLTGFVVTAIIDSARPAILSSTKISGDMFENRMTALYSVIILFSLMQSIVMTVFARVIILILYGSAYIESVNILRIIVWYTMFSYIGGVRNVWILVKGEHRLLSWINAAGAASNVILNALLIPVWGACGAAVASVATQFITNVGIGFILKPIRRNNILMLRSVSPRYIYKNIGGILSDKNTAKHADNLRNFPKEQ